MKTFKQITLTVFLIFLSFNIHAQTDSLNYTVPKWEASVSSGLSLDLFYSNISLFGKVKPDDRLDPLYYSDKRGKRVQAGKVDRIEIKYNFNQKASVSLNFSYALWRDLYGNGNDPLELWTETRRYNKRIQFAANYYRNFYSKNKRSIFNAGIGFLIQEEQISFPFYRVSPDDSTHILYMDARDLQYWPDWAVQLTGSYYYSVNRNLKIGATFYTYIIGTSIDGAGIMGSIAIPFGKNVKKKSLKSERK